MDAKRKEKKKISAKLKAKKDKVQDIVEEDDKAVASEAENEVVELLMKKTEFEEVSIRSQYKSFMSVCPSGQMSKEKFLSLYQQVLGDEASFLVEALFRIFDDDQSGSIDFQEFILALNATKYLESCYNNDDISYPHFM